MPPFQNMASKSVRVEISKVRYQRRMPFNRYAIERIDGIVVLHFGFVSQTSVLLDHFICAITQAELENQKKNLMDYLGKTGGLGEAPTAWQPPIGTRPVDLCNHIGLCGNPQIGEITLNNLIGRELSEVKGSQVIQAEPIAVLRSQMEIQKHWIKDLFK